MNKVKSTNMIMVAIMMILNSQMDATDNIVFKSINHEFIKVEDRLVTHGYRFTFSLVARFKVGFTASVLVEDFFVFLM